MAVGKKYESFTEWLCNNGTASVSISFSEMNQIIALPEYAYNHREAWANHSKPMSFSSCWLNAGYRVADVNLKRQLVLFERAHENAEKKAKKQGISTVPKLNVELAELIQKGAEIRDRIATVPNHRYKSWEYCFNVFNGQHAFQYEVQVDYLALHLAFYLASWGMYRGSSFLFQRDYKIHKPAVELLLDSQWADLRSISGDSLSEPQQAEKIILLSEQLSQVYERWAGGTPTDTLLTKILLGTLGCTPAYDTYLKTALKLTGIAEPKFTAASLQSLGRFYKNHEDELTELQASCSTTDLVYPPVKVLDMCFFEYGLAHALKPMDEHN